MTPDEILSQVRGQPEGTFYITPHHALRRKLHGWYYIGAGMDLMPDAAIAENIHVSIKHGTIWSFS